MTLKEKILYHQIHPVKLFVDISSGILTTVFAWEHQVVWFLILFLVPSVVVSWLIIKYSNLEPVKYSRLGKYIRHYMTKLIEAIRLIGQIIMWVAAWFHLPVFLVAGFLIIIGGWLNGIIFKQHIVKH